MGAREKLNTVVVWGCLIVAALLGLSFESYFVAAAAFVVMVGASYNAQGIRIQPDARRPSGGRGRGR